MIKRIGLLTSGGDCQALNATMRGVVKGLTNSIDDLEVYGFDDGYKGLIYGKYRMLTSKDFSGILLDILTEEYHPVPLDSSSALVCGQILVQNQRKTFCVITRFTLVYRNAGGRLQLSHIHNSYEYVPAGETPSLKLDLNTLKFVRSLILKQHSGKRIAVRSGNQTIFVDPYTVLYVQSQNKRTELVCADQVISCNSSLSDLARELPDIFYPLHRGYYVNTLYITAIRRFEAELISGAVLPIPALNYTKIRDDLLDRIQIKP